MMKADDLDKYLAIILITALLWHVAQFFLYAIVANLQVGPRQTLGSRDTPIELTGKAGRLQRALDNHKEALLLLIPAVLLLLLAPETSPGWAVDAGIVYLASRLLYLPAYIFGWVPWRSLIWAVGFFATLTILFAAATAWC